MHFYCVFRRTGLKSIPNIYKNLYYFSDVQIFNDNYFAILFFLNNNNLK